MDDRKDTQGQAKSAKRPKKKKKRISILGTLTYVAFVIGTSALLATVGWVAANDVLALNKEENSATITLPESIFTEEEIEVEHTDDDGNTTTTKKKVTVADLDYVVDYLKENGIIEYDWVFRLYAIFSHADQKLTPGTYTLDTTMDYRAIITNLGSASASRMVVEVTIPEGYTVAQVFQKLEEEGVSTVAKLNNMAANHDYAFSFLRDIPLGEPTRLEGYLFPDTYQFYKGEDAKYVINKMLVNFDARFTDAMREQAVEMGYTVGDMVILASLIEKETDGTDQYTVSSVLHNRLENTTGETVGLLQVDAAIAYVTGRVVTVEDYSEVDSPYNTYLNKGLPPGAIANPGMKAINAALNPDSTDYYYYVLGTDGVHHFFKTYQGHLDYIAQMKAAKSES